MFGLGKKQEPAQTASEPAADEAAESAASVGKGRPTPTRKEAEEARRRALKGPTDPKARRKAERERARQQRIQAREALMSGDERALPARDAGPAKRFVRDYIDGRRTLAEYFIIIAVVVLIVGLFRNPTVQVAVSFIWFVMLVLLVVDMTILLVRLRKRLAKEFPDPADRKGTMFYAAMRALQIRRLRLPPPKVKPGGRPVEPSR
jgi:Flp pilus assembly protein TadB